MGMADYEVCKQVVEVSQRYKHLFDNAPPGGH